jgi:NAD-dependent deacetylase
MAKPRINPGKIVILSGAGISAPSGLATFRDSGGLWEKHRVAEVATPEAWQLDPGLVTRFYNERRTQAAAAQPNAAHLAIARLQHRFETVVITQNVDDLHERGGSSTVIHLHGELGKARSSIDPDLIYPIGNSAIQMGDLCALGSQLRPDVVWFGEAVRHFEAAKEHILTAGRFLVVGTSLAVFPAAGLVKFARHQAEKILVDPLPGRRPFGFRVILGSADEALPALVNEWLCKADIPVPME